MIHYRFECPSCAYNDQSARNQCYELKNNPKQPFWPFKDPPGGSKRGLGVQGSERLEPYIFELNSTERSSENQPDSRTGHLNRTFHRRK